MRENEQIKSIIELKKQQDNNDSRINYLFTENQQLKNTLKKQKQNLIELARMINNIVDDMGDLN